MPGCFMGIKYWMPTCQAVIGHQDAFDQGVQASDLYTQLSAFAILFDIVDSHAWQMVRNFQSRPQSCARAQAN